MSAYPVEYAQHPPENRSRLTVFFRFLMVIPHAIVGVFYGIAAYLGVIVAWFALVFTGKYPQGIYDFVAGFARFNARFYGYYFLVTDEFPPFDGGDHSEYPVQVAIGPPLAEYNRIKVLFRIIVGIPVFVILYIMNLWATLVAIAIWFVAVFTGKTSSGLMEAMRTPMAYQVRGIAYILLLTEDWPPFDAGPNQISGGTQAPLGAGPEAL